MTSRTVFEYLGLDSQIIATLLFRSWSILAGGITTVMIPIFLSQDQQGYYYTFSALLGTQVLFELGLNYVLVQISSHLSANLHRDSDRLEGDTYSKQRLISLFSLATKWYSFIAILFFFSVLFMGTLFFNRLGSLATEEWLLIWIVLAALTTMNLGLSSRLSIYEGIGEITQIASLRLRQSMVGYFIAWILLLSHSGLWAIAAVPFVSVINTIWWLYREPIIKNLRSSDSWEIKSPETGYSYKRDIFPLQWRIGISWASGYFISFFIVPIIFAKQGAAEAGRIGLVFSLFSSITIIGVGWISAKIPQFGSYIARDQRNELDTLFALVSSRAIAATTLGVSILIPVIEYAREIIPIVDQRIPSLSIIVLLGVACIVNVINFSMAAYVRAHKEEPMVLVSVATAILIGTIVFFTASLGSIIPILAYASVLSLISLPWIFIIYTKYRKQSC